MNKINYMDMTIQPPVSTPQASINLDAQNNNVQQQVATRIPLGVTLVGQIAGNDKNGNIIIKLAGNDLILSSPLALSKESQVALRVENVSGTMVAQLLSVDGKLPATQPQAISNQLMHNAQQLKTAQGAPLLPNTDGSVPAKIISVLNSGAAKVVEQVQTQQAQNILKSDMVSLSSPQNAVIKGIIIAPSPEIVQGLRAAVSEPGQVKNSKLAGSIPDELKPGSTVNVKVTGYNPPPSNPQQQVQTDNSTLKKQDWMQQQNQQIEDNVEQNLQTNNNNLPTQAKTTQPQFDMRQQLNAFLPSMKPAGNGNIQLNALVIDAKPNGEMLVETKMGKMLIDGGTQFSTITKGTQLTLELTELGSAPKVIIKLPEEQLPAQQLSKTWPALKALTEQASGMNMAMDNISQKVAGVDNLFAARLAGFITAVKTDNLRDWLGTSAYDELEADEVGSSLLGKLRHDMGTIREMFNQPTQNGWQTMLFPVFDGRELHQARLYVKDLPDEEKDNERSAGTRFVMELETSYFGEMQFDGLVHNTVPAKHFDLMVRTHKPLDEDIMDDIYQIFNTASEITGFKGNIEFATMREFPVRVFDEMVEKKINQQLDHKGIEV